MKRDLQRLTSVVFWVSLQVHKSFSMYTDTETQKKKFVSRCTPLFTYVHHFTYRCLYLYTKTYKCKNRHGTWLSPFSVFCVAFYIYRSLYADTDAYKKAICGVAYKSFQVHSYLALASDSTCNDVLDLCGVVCSVFWKDILDLYLERLVSDVLDKYLERRT